MAVKIRFFNFISYKEFFMFYNDPLLPLKSAFFNKFMALVFANSRDNTSIINIVKP